MTWVSHRRSLGLLGAALIVAGLFWPSDCLGAEAKKWAFLVGVNKYDNADILPSLQYGENDVTALAELLRSYGYEATILTDGASAKAKDPGLKPNGANIQKQLDKQLKKCAAGDVLVIGLSGHGVYFDKTEESYFCPQDAKPTADGKGLDTLLSLKALYSQLGTSKAAKVLLVDACRNDPVKSIGLTDKTTPTPPKNTVALFSCSIGQMSWEIDKFQHGVFFNYVLDGLKGRALNNEEGNITWDRLDEYVRREVSREAVRLGIEEGGKKIRQDPTRVGEESGEPLVLIARGGLHILWDPIDQATAGRSKLPKASQPQIIFVIPGGGGEQIGLRSGDVIMQVNGHETKTGAALIRELGEVKAGTLLELIVLRDGDKKMLTGKYQPCLSRSEIFRRVNDLQGNDSALQHVRGWLYSTGIGVPRDENESTQWYRKAAENGFVASQRQLGWRYLNGVGVKRDDSEAMNWYRKAAGKGDAESQRVLGWLYEQGIGTKKDAQEAEWWYQKAAVQENPTAQLNLGLMCYNGRLGPADYKEAAKWFRKAADQGLSDGENWLGVLYQRGQGLDRDDGEAVKWYRKAAEQGNAWGQTNLGWMYAEGRGVTRDDKQAVMWYRRAFAQSHPQAMSHLGWMYETGRAVEKSLDEAARLYRKAADLGNAQGQYYLAALYYDGRACKKDQTEALRLYRKAADQGHAAAQNKVGEMLQAGDTAPADPQGAFAWFEKAAKQGNSAAQVHLAACYEKGIGAKQDQKLALEWYRKAAAQGVEEAKTAVTRLEKTRTP